MKLIFLQTFPKETSFDTPVFKSWTNEQMTNLWYKSIPDFFSCFPPYTSDIIFIITGILTFFGILADGLFSGDPTIY